MAHYFKLETERLSIDPLTVEDNLFLRELLNTEGWKRFIGDRRVHTEERADSYIKDILNDSEVSYWVISLKDGKDKVGVITFIKRDRAIHPDIGCALITEQMGKGFAFEAASAFLKKVAGQFSTVLGITLSDNQKSISLLKKLGFQLQEENKEGPSLIFKINPQ